jgi:hypothetical protein
MQTKLQRKDFEKVVNLFLEESNKSYHRYRSFDYCYNYFHTTKDLTKDIEKSSLTLGFYLASWGMLSHSRLIQLDLKMNGMHRKSKITPRAWDVAYFDEDGGKNDF